MKYTLTESAIQKLTGVIQRQLSESNFNSHVNGPGPNGIDGEEQQASDVYIARTPIAGIPALNDGYLGTGTSTNTDPLDDTPNSAYCSIYQLIDDSAGCRLKPIGNFDLKVYNLSTTAVPGDSWITVTKDKFGKWLSPLGSSSSTSSDSTTGMKVVDAVHVVDIAYTGTGTGTDVVPQWYCERVYRSGGGLTADPTVIYSDVRESENRYPRMRDASGSPTHIIPLFQDVNGAYFIDYPMVDTFVDIEVPTSFSTSFNTLTCVMTITPIFTTYRIHLEVTDVSDRTTALSLRIETL